MCRGEGGKEADRHGERLKGDGGAAVSTYIAYSRMTGNAEAMSKSSSVLRRLISGTPFLILIGGFGLGGLFGGFLGI